MRKIAVISCNKRQFRDFVNHYLCPDDRDKFHCVTSHKDIEGRFFSDVIRIGSFYEIRDVDDLYMRITGRIIHKQVS